MAGSYVVGSCQELLHVTAFNGMDICHNVAYSYLITTSSFSAL